MSYFLVSESILPKVVPFIIHKHSPRNGSLHLDLRFLDPYDSKNLYSFALPKEYKFSDKKTIAIKTRDHDPRWLTLKSYRLNSVDYGNVIIYIATTKYLELEFKGNQLKGKYRLFKLSKTKRDDEWLLVKNG